MKKIVIIVALLTSVFFMGATNYEVPEEIQDKKLNGNVESIKTWTYDFVDEDIDNAKYYDINYYDGDNNIIKYEHYTDDKLKTVNQYIYNSKGKFEKIEQYSGDELMNEIIYTYSEDPNQVIEENYSGDDLITKTVYQLKNRGKDIKGVKLYLGEDLNMNQSYSYDAKNNLANMSQFNYDSGVSIETYFTYDDQGREISRLAHYSDGRVDEDYYSYDNQLISSHTSKQYSKDNPDQMINYTFIDENFEDVYAYEFDELGNWTAKIQKRADGLTIKTVREITYKEYVVPKKLVSEIMNTKVVPAMSDEEFLKQVDEGKIYCNWSTIDEEGLHTEDDAKIKMYFDRILEIAKVLAVHAEKNNHTISVGTDINGTGVFVFYGEDVESLKKEHYMFRIGFKKQVNWASDENIDGKVYPMEREIRMSVFRTPLEVLNITDDTIEQLEYMYENNYTEVGSVHAFYDGLRALDNDISEELFYRILEEYCYATTYDYGGVGGMSGSNWTQYFKWFEVEGQKICKEEWRNSYGNYVSFHYMFLKQ